QRPRGAREHRRRRQRLRHGQPRDVRQGRPGRPGGRRRADPPRAGAHRRRHRLMAAPSNPELLDIAARIAERAAPGEQVEAFVARSTSTSVRAYGGEVESLTQASSGGVGVRVIVDQREGFAYAGTLDEKVVLEALAEARDNA